MSQPVDPTVLDRILRAFRALVKTVAPNLLYFATWEYQIQSADGSTFDGAPTEQGIPLPALVGVPYMPALAGTTCVPKQGSIAYVTFANGDPSKPVLVGFGPSPGPTGGASGLPIATRIDATLVTVGDPAGAPLAVARITDSTQGGTLVLSPGTQTLTYVPPGGGAPVVSPPGTIFLTGTITSGSTKLQAE
jgi:hypothetical protein